MENDVRVLRTEKNAVFEFIVQSGLDPSEFRWEEGQFEEIIPNYGATYSTASRLRHVPSKFYFSFGKYYDQFSPGVRNRVEMINLTTERWDVRFESLQTWLARLKEEVEAPDLWLEALQDRQLFQIASESLQSNGQFSPEEKAHVIRELAEVRRLLISAHHLQHHQSEALERGFDYVVQAMDRLGKKDWINLAMGALVNIAVTAAFAPAAASDLLHQFRVVVSPLYDAVLRLLS
jgi:hypothetical protein